MSLRFKIGLFIAAGIMLSACRTTEVPLAYQFSAREIKTNPYGCWMVATVVSRDDPSVQSIAAGELICMNADTLWVLVMDYRISSLPVRNLQQVRLFTHENQSGNYFLTGSLFFIPNVIGAMVHGDYALDFIGIGIPIVAWGASHSLLEGVFKRNALYYPKRNSLADMAPFARFPAGKPKHMDIGQLTLKP